MHRFSQRAFARISLMLLFTSLKLAPHLFVPIAVVAYLYLGLIYGDTVLTVESMKMENAVTATANGTISAIHVKQGDFVNDGQQVAMIS